MILETFPGLLLVIMLAITLILLPRLSDEHRSDTETVRRTEKLPINSQHDSQNVKRKT
jgi:hypothetical protein